MLEHGVCTVYMHVYFADKVVQGSCFKDSDTARLTILEHYYHLISSGMLLVSSHIVHITIAASSLSRPQAHLTQVLHVVNYMKPQHD